MTIHLIAAGELENPSKWSKLWHRCYNIWKSSPYEIKLWGDEAIDELLKEDDKEFFTTLNTLHPIYKWDYIRYLILEKFGGAYFDMDVEIIDPSFFSKLKQGEIYIAEGDWNCHLSNHILINLNPTPTNKLIWNSLKEKSKQKIYANLEKCLDNPTHTLYVAGPIFLSTFSSKYHFDHTPLGTYQFSLLTALSYSIHHNFSNWKK